MRIDLTKYHIFSRISIYILAAVLLCIGVYHLAKPNDLLVYVPFFLPGGIKWAYLVGVCFILVGLSFIVNFYVKLTSYLLAFFLFFFVLSVHVPNFFNAAMQDMRTFALINILKDKNNIYLEKINETNTRKIVMGPGQAIYIPSGTPHTFVPLTDCKSISLLTKRWDHCLEPITAV